MFGINLLDIIKCIPLIGTAITALEAGSALFLEGNGTKTVSKLAETCVGAAMDTAFIVTGSASSLMSAPAKAGAVEAGKRVAKKLFEFLFIRETGKLAARTAVEYIDYKTSESSIGHSHSSRGDGKGSVTLNRSSKLICLNFQNNL